MGTIVAVLSKKGEDAGEVAFTMLEASGSESPRLYGMASSSAVSLEESPTRLRHRYIDSSIIVGYALSRILTEDKPQPLKLSKATLVFDGRTYSENAGNSDAEVVAEKLWQNHVEKAKTLIQEAEGDFAYVIAEPERLIAGRDALGVRPLYHGENADLIALASERKALWKINVEKTDSFPPGHLAVIDKHGIDFILAKRLAYSKPKQMTMPTVARELRTLLEKEVLKRVSGLKEVAIAFSGGLDSSLVTFLAKNSGTNVHLIHASLADQPETSHAKRVAEELKLPIQVCLHEEKDVEEVLPKVLRLVEEPDPVQIGIGIPVFWSAEETSKMGFKVMLAGQGADELFGGYKRYVDEYVQYGKEKAQKILFSDIFNLHKTNLERDSKICNFHNIELRLPFATYQMAEFALGLPLELKMEPEDSTSRKLALRQVAQDLGLPQQVVNRPKKAIQYTTGVNATLRKLAKKKELSLNEYVQQVFRKSFGKDDAC